MADTGGVIAVVLHNTSTDAVVYDANHTTEDSYIDFPPFEDPSEMAWAIAIQKNYLKVICAVGLPGNLAAILTIISMKPRSVATFLVALLAASDSLALVMKLAVTQLYFTLPEMTTGYCRTVRTVNVFSSYANWVLVLIAAERLVAVVRPLSRDRCLSKARVYCVCVLTAVPIVAVHAPLVVGGVATGRFRCWLKDEVMEYAEGAFRVLNDLLYAFLPIVLLMTITTAMSLALSRARRSRQVLLGSAGGGGQASREMARCERAITAMMLAASLLFMMMVLPQCLYFIFFKYTKVLVHLQHTPRDHLIKQVTTLLADSTHALNFYLYFVSVRRFRQRVLGLLCCGSRCSPWGGRPLAQERSSISRTWVAGSSENGSSSNNSSGCQASSHQHLRCHSQSRPHRAAATKAGGGGPRKERSSSATNTTTIPIANFVESTTTLEVVSLGEISSCS